MDLMPGRVVHDIPHGYVVLRLEDLNDLVAALGHFDVDRLFLSSQGHEVNEKEEEAAKREWFSPSRPRRVRLQPPLKRIKWNNLRFYSEDTSY